MLESGLGRIGDKAALGAYGQHLIEGLVRLDLARLARQAGIGGVDVDHHATKGGVAVTDDLAEAEFRDGLLGHDATLPDPT